MNILVVDWEISSLTENSGWVIKGDIASEKNHISPKIVDMNLLNESFMELETVNGIVYRLYFNERKKQKQIKTILFKWNIIETNPFNCDSKKKLVGFLDEICTMPFVTDVINNTFLDDYIFTETTDGTFQLYLSEYVGDKNNLKNRKPQKINYIPCNDYMQCEL